MGKKEFYERKERGQYDAWMKRWIDDKGFEREPERICAALQQYGEGVTGSTFRRVRARLASFQKTDGCDDAAQKILQTQNLVPPGQRVRKTAKRTKKATRDDFHALAGSLKKVGDQVSLMALVLVYETGMRPLELLNATISGRILTIVGAKYNEDRGIAVRCIALDESVACDVGVLLLGLQSAVTTPQQMKNLENRISRHAKKLWPRKRYRKSLYSFRHKMGSDLKAMELDPVEIAAILGHRSVNSQGSYGRKYFGGDRRSIAATPETMAKVNPTSRSVSEIWHLAHTECEDL